MQIHHQIEFVDGEINTETQELICVYNKKYGMVELCFKGPMHIGFASIKLHSDDLASAADAVFNDAVKLGEEIANRWNTNRESKSKPQYVYIIRDAATPSIYGIYYDMDKAARSFCNNGYPLINTELPSYDSIIEQLSQDGRRHVCSYWEGTSRQKSLLVKEEVYD